MACYKPLSGYRAKDGRLRPNTLKGTDHYLEVPCGYCIGCRIDRARDWKIRMYHESQMHEGNSFITLTYADKYLPPNQSLELAHFQKFMKRLRKNLGTRIRFFHAGEYGGEKGEPIGRPHYHAIIFGHDFTDDREPAMKGNQGHTFYRSPELEKAWPFGFSTIGDVTPETCGYVAKYMFKKMVGDLAETHYARIDQETGEMKPVTHEYATMSRMPGLGYSFFQKYWKDIYAIDACVIKGKENPVPRYYDRLLERKDPELLAQVQEAREVDGNRPNVIANKTDQRLADRETFTKSKLDFFDSRNHLK